MDTLAAMRCYQLAPVGNPVSYKHAPGKVEGLFPGQAFFVDSGTSALALALMAAFELTRVKNRAKAQPEIIMPAYACPDLISAIVYAGAKPVLVDLEVDTPWMDLTQVKEAINDNTIALIAVNFLGIAERLTALKALSTAHDLFLIEDNAQSMCFDSADSPEQIGDIAIRSFGRGKPLSILGGGVVYSQRQDVGDVLSRLLRALPQMPFGALDFSCKVRVYNALLNPVFYWIPASLPFLHLGETRFTPLSSLMRLDPVRGTILAENYRIFQAGCYDRTPFIVAALSTLNAANLVNLPALSMGPVSRLLRYPLLLPTQAIRDQVLKRAKVAGLGVSIMYGKALFDFDFFRDVFPQKNRDKSWVAQDFANRLITLPTHCYVNERNATRMAAILAEELC